MLPRLACQLVPGNAAAAVAAYAVGVAAAAVVEHYVAVVAAVVNVAEFAAAQRTAVQILVDLAPSLGQVVAHAVDDVTAADQTALIPAVLAGDAQACRSQQIQLADRTVLQAEYPVHQQRKVSVQQVLCLCCYVPVHWTAA